MRFYVERLKAKVKFVIYFMEVSRVKTVQGDQVMGLDKGLRQLYTIRIN